ncbi:MAG TPA: zinc ribbon domain-containing protein [Ktedonobacterales bacterium]|nr:zinc ribbon domain-containing protein [Ktedonobacterales bacterium]
MPPASTAHACSGCGVLVQQGLAVRWHACPERGTSLHRDHNAALNILGARQARTWGRAGPSGANVARWGMPSLKNPPPLGVGRVK